MWPASSVSGLYFAHPDSKYFAVGKLGRDQVLDCHLRKQMDLREVERWRGPYLAYEPDVESKTILATEKVQPHGPASCSCGRPHPIVASGDQGTPIR